MPDKRRPAELSILTLNLSSPTPERAKGLLEYLWHREEELLVLTEVARGSGSVLVRQVCEAAGYQVAAMGIAGAPSSGLGVMVVNRSPIRVEFDQTPLAPRVATARSRTTVVAGVYGQASDPVRYSSASQRQAKRDWLDQFLTWTEQQPPGVIIGDLNIVDPDADASLKYVLAEEVQAYRNLTDRYVDAFRQFHGPDVSWVDHSGVGCRYDHALVSRDIRVLECELDHSPRERGLTDHSALTLTVEL